MPIAVQVVDSLDRVFHDTTISAGHRPQPIILATPRGGRCSFQLACRGFTREPRIGLRNLRLAKTIRRVLFVPVEANTAWDPIAIPLKDRSEETRSELFIDRSLDPRMRPHVIKEAPFEVAEVLAPLGTHEVERDRPTVFHVVLQIPRSVGPGTLRGTVTVNDVEINLEIHISRMEAPTKQTLKVTQWFSLENIARYHHLTIWSSSWWTMLGRYARLMREYGQNVFWLPLEVFVDIDRKGKIAYHWDRLDRYVTLFFKENFEMIEGGHWLARIPGDITGTGRYSLLKTGIDPLCPEGQKLLRTVTARLWRYLKEKKWDSRYVQHVADEPAPVEAPAYLAAANLLRRAMPGVRLIDAIGGTPLLQGLLDIHVPNIGDLHLPGVDRDKDFDRRWNAKCFRTLAKNGGGDFWFYTCCGPRGPAMNRFLDFPLIRTRLLHWLNYVTGATGYLHWGLNMYLNGQNPFRESVNPVGPMCPCLLPPGDMHIVWPGKDGPWPSLRLEAMRDGIDDYELLRSTDSMTLARRMVRSCVDYTEDIQAFRRIYQKLLTRV